LYLSLISHGIRNIILYAIRYNQTIVGFIWAANYDTEKMEKIKETLELSTFLIAAVITNHQLLSRLEERSSVDILTNVGSRNAMDDRIDKYISGEEELPHVMGIAFADLNGLKAVNDDEGHDAGDKLLKRAAALLKIAFGDYGIYRAGGDEFMVIMRKVGTEEVEAILRMLDAKLEVINTVKTEPWDYSTAYGYGFRVECGKDCDDYIHQTYLLADQRMYEAKKLHHKKHRIAPR
jgi:diguanylate cyclase (GGDEF)-like protein